MCIYIYVYIHRHVHVFFLLVSLSLFIAYIYIDIYMYLYICKADLPRCVSDALAILFVTLYKKTKTKQSRRRGYSCTLGSAFVV